MTTLENARQLTEYLQNRKYYTTEMSILRHFQWSRATFYRVLAKARQSGEEIESKRGIGYLLLARSTNTAWKGFSSQELEMLALLWKTLESREKWVDQYLGMKSGLMERLRLLGIPIENWEGRIHYLPPHSRQIKPGVFLKISRALMHRRPLRFTYKKSNGCTETRTVHPQQLVLYRNGWSLDALDESRIGKTGQTDLGIRQFSLDLINEVKEMQAKWVEVSIELLRESLSEGYGLFAGRTNAEAVLQFTGVASFYAQREQWHPNQRIKTHQNGSTTLYIPYVSQHPEELLGDILRWGANAQVIGPPELKNQWIQKIRELADSVS